MGKKDIFTSVVRVKGSNRFKVIPVKSSAEVEKELWIEMSKVVSRLYVSVPIKMGSIICFILAIKILILQEYVLLNRMME